jgi:hypothetical protein
MGDETILFGRSIAPPAIRLPNGGQGTLLDSASEFKNPRRPPRRAELDYRPPVMLMNSYYEFP